MALFQTVHKSGSGNGSVVCVCVTMSDLVRAVHYWNSMCDCEAD